LATLAEGRKAVACSRPLDPKSTQSLAAKGQSQARRQRDVSAASQGDSRPGVSGPLMPTFCGSCPACRLRTTVPVTACWFGSRCTRQDCWYAHASPAGTRHEACRYGIQCQSSACKFAHPSKSLVCNSNGAAAEECDQVTTTTARRRWKRWKRNS
jgi:hypothetical protein